uniref:Tle cognate immunity protein 4 C-terminal domain-containing protein n=1 Tax=Bosea sp. NBC_00436 TaxID=2969620 RepID=A0A9E7ZS53_9HYPH
MVGFISASSAFPALADDAIVPEIRLQKEETNGWSLRSFDFGDDDINFETYVPDTAKVETTGMRELDAAKEIGSVKIIGKIRLANAPIEATIKGYRLTTPASAARVCAYEIEASGYTLRQIRSVSDYSATQAFAVQPAEAPYKSGAFSQCFSRGDKVLTFHVVADLSKAANDGERKEIGKIARNVAGALFTNLVFSNGRVQGYDEYMKRIGIRIGASTIAFTVPDIWKVAINDFRGPLPAELHLQREKDGRTQGLFWLSAQERKDKPNLQEVGPALIRDYFVQQSPDVKPPTLLASSEDKDFKKAGVTSRLFRFSVTKKDGEDGGDLIANVIWHDQKLYVASIWSRLSPSGDPDTFFSRLPGLTAFDLVQASLLQAVTSRQEGSK